MLTSAHQIEQCHKPEDYNNMSWFLSNHEGESNGKF